LQLLERMSEAMHIGFSARPWAALALFCVFPLLMVTSPAVLVNDMPMDIYVPLDGGWRVAQGQTPHLDFHTPVGLLYYETYGAAMGIFGPTARVLIFVPALFSLVLIAIVALVTRSRLPDGVRALFCAYLGFIALSPMHLDNDALVHLASYNRFGWTLVTALLLLVSLPPHHRSRRQEAMEIGVATALLWTLFFLKITYFGIGGLAVLLSVVFVSENRRLALTAGVLTWVGLGIAFLVSEVPALYIADLLYTLNSADPQWAHYNAARTPGFGKLAGDVLANGPLILLAVLALPLTDRFKTVDTNLQYDRLFALLVLLLVLFGNVQSHDHHAPGLVAAAAVGLGTAVRLQQRRISALLFLAIALILGIRMTRDARAIAVHHWVSGDTERTLAATGITGSPGADLRYLVDDGDAAQSALRYVVDGDIDPTIYRALNRPMNGADLRLMLDAGSTLIETQNLSKPRVFTLLFSAPYPYLLGTPPPAGTLSWYHPSRTFGGKNPLVPSEQFSDVDMVLVPRALRTPPIRAMLIDLQPALDRDWQVASQTPLWTLYRRR
jgi:hypothetical protein